MDEGFIPLDDDTNAVAELAKRHKEVDRYREYIGKDSWEELRLTAEEIFRGGSPAICALTDTINRANQLRYEE